MTRSSPAIDPAPACSRTWPARCCPWPVPPCSLLLAPPYDGGSTKSRRRVPSADPTVDGCCGRLDLELIYQSSAQVNWPEMRFRGTVDNTRRAHVHGRIVAGHGPGDVRGRGLEAERLGRDLRGDEPGDRRGDRHHPAGR